MAVLFSTEFNISEELLSNLGVFNAFIDEDSNFFINIKRLQLTSVPEFAQSYDRLNTYFHDIGILLKCSKSENDKTYRSAFKRFNFPEVNGINLGFSSGRHGAGFGIELRKQIIKDAYQIIQSGTEAPEIFHLTSLFEENVGPDRISDMVARIIYQDILAYSKRIYKELSITSQNFPDYKFNDGIVINPYKRVKLLLLPVEILHELPIARCWDDIDRVCKENDAIKAEINDFIGTEWSKLHSSERKHYLKEWVFKNPERAQRVISSYREASVEKYDIFHNIEYLVRYIQSTFPVSSILSDDSLETALDIIDSYREFIEFHKGSSFIQNSDKRNKEKIAQRILYAVAFKYCQTFNWDLSPETDSGRGPVDFKISRGNDKTVIEIKLTSNPECVHGLEIQIEEYAKAEGTDKKVFLLINTGENEGRIQTVLKKHDEMVSKGLNPAKVIVIDAKVKPSASVY